jgi:protein-S-isoprenylcysteine O-methyltransferase Ste14
MELFAMTGIVQAAATIFFAAFWIGFPFWRRHRAAAYAMIFGTLAGVAAIAWWQRAWMLQWRADVPVFAQAIGWAWLAVVWVFGWIADRQLGFHVRSFAPFFAGDRDGEKIALRTTGAYAVVRHPIYAAGIAWQLGVLLVTGYAAVGAATLVFGLGAAWFTRQEERRLIGALEDPAAYDRYRARVPRLLPWPRPRARARV